MQISCFKNQTGILTVACSHWLSLCRPVGLTFVSISLAWYNKHNSLPHVGIYDKHKNTHTPFHLYPALPPVMVASVYLLLLRLVINAVHRPPQVWKLTIKAKEKKRHKRSSDLSQLHKGVSLSAPCLLISISQDSYHPFVYSFVGVFFGFPPHRGYINIMGWKLQVDDTKPQLFAERN